jgi:hypothetical protein
VARNTLTAHRAEVRRLVGDPAGASAVWTDDDLDAALDQARTFNQYRELVPVVNRATNRYELFEGPPWWEAPVTLNDWAIQEVLPGDVDLKAGTFRFDPGRLDSYLTATGWTYDLAGAAVRVLDWWLARLKNEYDVSVGGDSFSRSQKVENLQALRESLLAKSSLIGGSTSVPSYRSDLVPGRRP